jgi:hypothetical protein
MLVTPSVFRSNTNELELEELPVIVRVVMFCLFITKLLVGFSQDVRMMEKMV